MQYTNLAGKGIAVLSLGCKVNQYEADAMIELFQQAGAVQADEKHADICIINTCSVTNMADRKSRQILHRIRRENPGVILAATGCYVQAAAEELLRSHTVDVIIGNNRKGDAVRILSEYISGGASAVKDNYVNVNRDPAFENLTIRRPEKHTRAFVKIQDGCNNFCTYCIIPYVRGRIKSRNLSEILEEVRTIADNGVQEVVLTGINLSSYDDDETDARLQDVIREVSQIPGIARIRLGSLEPRVITESFMETVSSLPNFCPHFHLSVQSACNRTLREMNRKYTIEDFFEVTDRIRRYYDRPALTSDIIVGFPGETEGDFEETVRNLERIRFYEMHVFKYSRRKGTPADKRKDQIPESVKNERSQVLLSMRARQKAAYESSFRGETADVLVEEIIRENGISYYQGHTERYMLVKVKCSSVGDGSVHPEMINHMLRVKL